jgi:hypothetical protein
VGAQFGASLAAAGDVNGDDKQDLIAGAPLYDTHEIDAGAAFVYPLPEPGVLSGWLVGAVFVGGMRSLRSLCRPTRG